ncbi:MAG: 8-amino-7-oxononanoate synthase [Candidatus Sabulitectum sp.]|nr:8-amino-7-oxononanoate synthase [Candidatus Sabulitectum sp.]
MSFESARLTELKNQGLLRELKLRNRYLLNFSTNDYLNLSSHQLVKKRAIEAVKNWGAGAGGSRLMAGNLSLHEELERKLAELTGMGSALIFGSGFLTNLGVLTALAGGDDVIFSDRLNHASLVDGAIMSRAEVRRYRHCDVEHLADLVRSSGSSGKKIIVTDSVFSMDGDIAPLLDIYELAVSEGCLLVVDEAHAVGVFGSGGGVCRSLSIQPDVITGTLSKALGGYGGFASCSASLRSFFVNRSRSFVYTTGLPPSSIGAALGALELINSSSNMGETLLTNAALFRERLNKMGFDTCGSASQIIPVIAGDSSNAVSFSEYLEEAGILAVAIRPPTVPEGSARLRFSLTMSHSNQDTDKVISAMEEIKWK